MKHPSCFVCKKAAVHRCDECSPDGKLFLCGDTGCFHKVHNEFVATRHRLLLVAWDGKVKWAAKCCATHKNKPLEYWCDVCRVPVCQQCWSHGKHVDHSTSLVTDVWRPLQAELRKTVKALDAKVAENTERLDRLATIREEAGQRDGVGGAACRALDEVEVQFADKMRVLRAELEAMAASWRVKTADEHNKLARKIARARALARNMHAVCDEEEEECAQQVVLKYMDLGKWQEALQAPLWTTVPMDPAIVVLAEAALTKAIADLSFASVCTSCQRMYPGAVGACALCLASSAKQGRFQSDEEVLWCKDHDVASNILDVAAVYNSVGNVYCERGECNKALRWHNKARTIFEEKAPDSFDLSMTRYKIGSVYYKQDTFAKRCLRGERAQKPHTSQ